jgi:hypothetical protein
VKIILGRLLDVSLLAAVPAGLANSWGYHGAALVLAGVGIGFAISVLVCAARAAHMRNGNLLDVDQEAGIALIELKCGDRTVRRWLPIHEILCTPSAPRGR